MKIYILHGLTFPFSSDIGFGKHQLLIFLSSSEPKCGSIYCQYCSIWRVWIPLCLLLQGLLESRDHALIRATVYIH